MSQPVYVFGDLRFDADARLLWRGGELVVIGSRATALLALLLARRGAVLTRDELIEAAWPGQLVEESNLSVQIGKLRRAVGAHRIGTVERVGYRWLDLPAARHASGVAGQTGRTRMPSVAVLPFDVGDASAAPEAGRLVDETIAALVPFRTLEVVAADRAARFVLRGKVGTRHERMHATLLLVDTLSGVHVWAGGFDCAEDPAGAIAAAVESRVHLSEIATHAERRPNAAEAYDLYLKGRARQLSSEVRDNAEAFALHSAALALEPDNPVFLSAAAETLHHRRAVGWPNLTDADRAGARDLARRALNAPDIDGVSLGLIGNTLMTSGEEDWGLALCRRGAALNPNSPLAMTCVGLAEMWADNLEIADASLARATNLDPSDPTVRFGLEMRARIALMRGEPQTALDLAHRALAVSPALSGAYWAIIEAHHALGHGDKARRALAAYQRFAPDVSIKGIEAGQPFARPQRMQGLIEAVRSAGMPQV